MENLNVEQTKQALKACISSPPNCNECPMPEVRGCAVKLYTQALRTIERQEAEYHELYEIVEDYRMGIRTVQDTGENV